MTVAAPTWTARQEQLLEAAVRVTARSGLRGLTHRAVDREAGLSEGTCSAYMRTRAALLTALTTFVTAHFWRDVQALTGRIEACADGDEGYAVQQTATMLLDWLGETDLLLTRVELTLEGARQPEVAAASQTWWPDLVEVVDHALATGGKPHSRARAETLIAAIDGVLLRALRETPADRPAFLRRSLELLMGTLAGEGSGPTV